MMNELIENSKRPLCVGPIALLLLGFMTNLIYSNGATEKLALITGYTLANSYVWNLLTSCFYETNVVKLCLDVVSFVVVSRGVQIKGGLDQFCLFIIFTLLASTMCTTTYCFIRFFATSLEEMLMEPIYGFSGVFMAYSMYARMIQRGESVHNAIPQLTYQNLPLVVIAAQLLLWLVGLRVLALDLPFTIVSLLFSWSYLRFFYRFEGDGVLLGDRSEEFAFVVMFPEPLHPVAIPLTTAFYNIFALVGLFPDLETVSEADKRQRHHLRYENSKVPESPLLAPTRQDVVMERRRAKALKLLDAKMAELSKESEGWDVGTDGNDEEAPTTLSMIQPPTLRV